MPQQFRSYIFHLQHFSRILQLFHYPNPDSHQEHTAPILIATLLVPIFLASTHAPFHYHRSARQHCPPLCAISRVSPESSNDPFPFASSCSYQIFSACRARHHITLVAIYHYLFAINKVDFIVRVNETVHHVWPYIVSRAMKASFAMRDNHCSVTKEAKFLAQRWSCS